MLFAVIFAPNATFYVGDGTSSVAADGDIINYPAPDVGALNLVAIRRTGDQMTIYTTDDGWYTPAAGAGAGGLDPSNTQPMKFGAVDEPATNVSSLEHYGVRVWTDRSLTDAELADWQTTVGI